MKDICIVFIITILLVGCRGKALETEKSGDFEIELLFEKDGCKMYRFKDGGRTVYWSNCKGRTAYRYQQSKDHWVTIESLTS